jgi:hypothetical protein
MPRKNSKLNSLKQTHGKDNEATFEITSLDQLFGSSDSTKFGTTDETVFADKLRSMTRADLENFARRHGSIIVESSDRIRNELMKLFRNYVSLLQKPATKPVQGIKISPEVQQILNQGR